MDTTFNKKENKQAAGRLRWIIPLLIVVFFAACEEATKDLSKLAEGIGVPAETDKGEVSTDDTGSGNDLGGLDDLGNQTNDPANPVLRGQLGTSVTWGDQSVTLGWSMPESFPLELMTDVTFEICSANSSDECTSRNFTSIANYPRKFIDKFFSFYIRITKLRISSAK